MQRGLDSCNKTTGDLALKNHAVFSGDLGPAQLTKLSLGISSVPSGRLGGFASGSEEIQGLPRELGSNWNARTPTG